MPPVCVVSDTTHYLPDGTRTDSGLQTVSLYVNFDAEQPRHEREADLVDVADFYARLRQGSGVPTTSQPSIGDFLGVYEPLLADGRDIVSVHISGGISGTVESARQAAAQAVAGAPGRRIEVVDSRTAAAGLGLVALAAARAAAAGQDVDQVAARTRDAVEDVRIWFALDTLEFVRRGGRIGAAQAFLGGALKVKPVLTIRDEVQPIDRVRTSSRAFERLVRCLEEMRAAGSDAYAVQHIQSPDEAARLADRGRELFGRDPEFVSEVGPVIGTYAGPGMLGVAGLPARLLA
jgi:DegV family protein with EDD domain